MEKKPLLISACLLGEACRYDGRRVTDALSTPSLTAGEVLSLLRQRYRLIPVCPEVFGGLPTPRVPSERVGEWVMRRDGVDVTAMYQKGAEAVVHMCRTCGCRLALLKARSPACGRGQIYDGSFSGRLTARDGVCAEALRAVGVEVYTEEEISCLLSHKKT